MNVNFICSLISLVITVAFWVTALWGAPDNSALTPTMNWIGSFTGYGPWSAVVAVVAGALSMIVTLIIYFSAFLFIRFGWPFEWRDIA